MNELRAVEFFDTSEVLGKTLVVVIDTTEKLMYVSKNDHHGLWTDKIMNFAEAQNVVQAAEFYISVMMRKEKISDSQVVVGQI